MSTFLCLLLASGTVAVAQTGSNKVIHDAEYYVLEAQNGERWVAEDQTLDECQNSTGGETHRK